ncbi:hypothetical protein [Actinoplanes sp. NPDC051411]|uniref:hypothetical protein n=1 Tax=Actinoplanes sp. NPDC051411 TaxID=3155522 RepID=UPI0034416434
MLLAEAAQGWTADIDEVRVDEVLPPATGRQGSGAMSGRLPAVADRLWMMPEALIGLTGESVEVAEWLTRTDC